MIVSLRRGLLKRASRPASWSLSAPTAAQWCALAVLALLLLAALVPGLMAAHDPVALSQGPPREGPSLAHLFGTDEYGRDVFARVVWAARSSVLVGIAAPVLALLAGILLGSLAALAGRWAGAAVQRVIDVLVAFPAIILAVVLASVIGPGLVTTIVVLGAIYTPATARVVRANVEAQLTEDYVTAALSAGASRVRLLVRHIARNAFAPVVVFATSLIADAVFMEAALSFIGVGIQPPTPSWGNVINDGRVLVSSGGWWVTTFAGLAVFVCVLAVNLVSDWLADSLGKPRRTALPGAVPEAGAGTDGPGSAGGGEDPVRPWPRTPVDPAVLAARAPVPVPDAEPVLSIRDLRVSFPGSHGDVDVVAGVRLDVRPGEIVGLVGESGSGKSLTGLAVTGLLPPGAAVSGSVTFRGREILPLSPAERRPLLGHEIAMVYQDALSSLNPAMTVRQQLRQICRRGGTHTPEELLELVDLSPAAVLGARPHQLSGGQRQRVLIAMGLARDPSLLIADEPTTALDETVQAQVLETLERLRAERDLAILLVSHDLALVSALAHRVVVMYAGQVAETGPTRGLLADPVHPYTNGLLASVVSLERREEELAQISGTVPSPALFVPGCRFAPRCMNATERCVSEPPPLEPVPPVPAAAPAGRGGAADGAVPDGGLDGGRGASPEPQAPLDGGHPAACWHPMTRAQEVPR
ncbi:dipeptide/oligopeptide/nickel ABC transporter permease/ATP-binding protein [Streptomyces armeniacus]|nr:dipeptide/oligopeptide/nickel ABC transporter permease/ATP-binding protein [Streptomyces armeniacus]